MTQQMNEHEVDSGQSGPVILIVEDEPTISRVLAFWLKDSGFVDYTAGSAEEALDLLNLIEPALVVTDVRLPGIDGAELVRRIKAQRDIPAFLMSGHPEPRFHQADRFFSKPFDIEPLIDCIVGLKPQLAEAAQTAPPVMH